MRAKQSLGECDLDMQPKEVEEITETKGEGQRPNKRQ
jgi:hypothetical protein